MSELSVDLNAVSNSADPADSRSESADKQLMLRLKNGDSSAMNELVECHGEMLARLIGRLTGWHADRDDILQEALVKVWQQAGSYRGEGSLEGWLKRIAVNRCKNHFRSNSAFTRMIERFKLLISPNATPTLDSNIEQDDSSSGLQQALQQLSPTDRTVIVLFYLEELPSEEIASLLNIKLETFHVRLHRARHKLKQIIESQGDDLA